MILSLPSRNQLLSWVSQMTNNTVQKLEHLSDGLAFCQIFHKLYPNNINLSKLKKDAKVPLEKEKNFRMLLNAINHIGLCVAINIVDLSHGKVTAILQLLQWFYKQYKNPSGKIVSAQENGPKCNVSEPRMIKTYVGNLVERQRSCQKESKGKLFHHHLASSRRSVDTQLMKKTAYETDNSRKSNSIRFSQHKVNTEKKEKPSKVKSIKLSKGKFEQRCEEKRMTLKKQLTEKMSGKKSEVKSEKLISKEETFQEILCKVLNLQKPQLQKKLIRVTEAVIEGNPQLQAKIRRIMQTDSEKKQGPFKQMVSPDCQVRNILSFRNTSEICENDTLESIPQSSKKKQTDQDKKETVKKSAMKSYELPVNSPLLSQQFKPSQISAQKQKRNEIEPHFQGASHIDQDSYPNTHSMEPQKCYLFDPHISVEKAINPEALVTEKKVESQKEEDHSEFRRQVQSQNFTASFSKVDKNVWKENQAFGQNQNLRF